jgi:hypothetical protein
MPVIPEAARSNNRGTGKVNRLDIWLLRIPRQNTVSVSKRITTIMKSLLGRISETVEE